MKGIKKSYKPLMLISLLVMMTVLLLVPAEISAGYMSIQAPGHWTSGTYGKTCSCPWDPNMSNCTCTIVIFVPII